MTNPAAPSALSRTLNASVAASLAAFILVSYWPMIRLFDLSRADSQYQGVWIGDHSKQITSVTPGGVADRAGLRAGDVLEFDPSKEADWVSASYRKMPEGFSATLPVRRADGSSTVATFVPLRVAYLPTLYDQAAMVARLVASTIGIVLGVFVVWARPSLMAWCLLLTMTSVPPPVSWRIYYFAYEAGHGLNLAPIVLLFAGLQFAVVPFALCFPRNTILNWSWWKRALGVSVVFGWLAIWVRSNNLVPFEHDVPSKAVLSSWVAIVTLSGLIALTILWRTYQNSDGTDRARLKWAITGMAAVLVATVLALLFFIMPTILSSPLSGSGFSTGHWVIALCYGVVWPLALGYAILRQRVVDVQFAVSRTLAFGAVSTLALAILGGVNWLLGRLIEHSHLATGLEYMAAIGVGLAMNRATHGINRLLDRVLFHKHHQAELRLRRVTAALPYATDDGAIADAVVMEPVRNLKLASAALFFRDVADGPLRRVLAHGWSDEHATILDADALLVRYLQAEHESLKLDDPDLLSAGLPDGTALPVLAIPVVNQHQLIAVVLYGAHINSTLPDPDEMKLLDALVKAAATAHQQLRMAALTRENEAKQRQIAELSASEGELRALRAWAHSLSSRHPRSP